MIIVVTGMVGIDKKQYLQAVCDLVAQRGKKIALCSVGDMMYAEAPDIPPGKILDIPLQRLRSLRRSVFKDIIAKANTQENVIVNTHATFRWRHGLFPAFDFDQMRQLNADMYLCIVDSADALHLRLASEHTIQHSLKDLVVWREEEILATELMQQAVKENAVYHCLARGDGDATVETCYRLIFEKDRKKAYLSFPITHVMDMPDVIAEISKFRELMKEIFTCFDPGDLEEAYLPYYAAKAADAGYKLVIILSGIHNSLRLQTQRRIDRALGLDPAGAPEPDPGWRWIGLTSPTLHGDFRPGTIDANVLQGNERVLLVSKKNATVLRRLTRWIIWTQCSGLSKGVPWWVNCTSATPYTAA